MSKKEMASEEEGERETGRGERKEREIQRHTRKKWGGGLPERGRRGGGGGGEKHTGRRRRKKWVPELGKGGGGRHTHTHTLSLSLSLSLTHSLNDDEERAGFKPVWPGVAGTAWPVGSVESGMAFRVLAVSFSVERDAAPCRAVMSQLIAASGDWGLGRKRNSPLDTPAGTGDSLPA